MKRPTNPASSRGPDIILPPGIGKPIVQPNRTGLARRLRLARLEAAVTRPSTALLLGFFLLQVVGALLLAQRGMMHPQAWIACLLLGFALVAAKIALDMRDEELDEATLRDVLADQLGRNSITDEPVANQLETAIACRLRIEAKRALAEGASKPLFESAVPRIDEWLDGIGTLARRTARLRGESAAAAGQRIVQEQRRATLTARASETADPELLAQMRRTIRGVEDQMQATRAFAALAERGFLRLESAVADLDTVSHKLSLMLSRGEDLGDTSDLDNGIRTACDQIESFLRAVERVDRPSILEFERMT